MVFFEIDFKPDQLRRNCKVSVYKLKKTDTLVETGYNNDYTVARVPRFFAWKGIIMTNDFYSQFAGNSIKASILSVEILRDALIPKLLGDDSSGILYWAGKDLARQFPVASDDDLVTFFEQTGWGHLVVITTTDDLITYELTGEPVARRSATIKSPDFMLETGFLAEQSALRTNCVSEAKITFQNRMRLRISVTIDHNQPIVNHDPATPIEIVRPQVELDDEQPEEAQ